MRKGTSLFLSCVLCVGAVVAAPMNFRVIQPPYGMDASKVDMKDCGKAWDEALAKKVIRLIDAYDARRH